MDTTRPRKAARRAGVDEEDEEEGAARPAEIVALFGAIVWDTTKRMR